MINGDVRALIEEACAIAVSCPKGKFYPDKDFGIDIAAQRYSSNTGAVLAYARQAAAKIDGLYIKSAEITDGDIILTVIVNDEEGQVSFKL